ncbi:hypothetical protein BDQ12DRAFT_100739 [Crucibulum laeve]|uniref:Uncharacterized protein n=1 Tax=Crucibulum laeve TaxID=68775 RepID=A0A5C3M225_9AGAR|nr:hypothetical protein BDQ12DRAFT_100739 [Crucibulum laeve]
MNSPPPLDPRTSLPPDAVERVTKEARKEGFFAGLTGGLASAVLGGQVMRLSRNKTLFCGVLSGVLSGYLFTQAFTSTALAQLRAEEERLKAGPSNPGNSPNSEFLAE